MISVIPPEKIRPFFDRVNVWVPHVVSAETARKKPPRTNCRQILVTELVTRCRIPSESNYKHKKQIACVSPYTVVIYEGTTNQREAAAKVIQSP
jgi:hypothetical protein